MKLPIPLVRKGERHEEVILREITAGLLADTQKIIESGDSYRALACFAAGVIESIGEITDRAAIKNLANFLPYKSAEAVIIEALLQSDKDDGVEGYYECPRCGAAKLAEYNPEEELDTRDHLRDLPVKTTENSGFEYELKCPVEIRSGEDMVEMIKSISFIYPTLASCSAALSKVGLRDVVRLQMAVLLESVETINKNPVERNWKSNYGTYVFEKMKKGDLLEINRRINEFGMNPVVKKVCLKCQKEFEVVLNTSNFFASALQ